MGRLVAALRVPVRRDWSTHVKPCSTCKGPRTTPNQRYCRSCRAVYMRWWRKTRGERVKHKQVRLTRAEYMRAWRERRAKELQEIRDQYEK